VNTNEPVKILFRYHSAALEEVIVETMWADVIDEAQGLYKLNSIPFYGPPVASGDIFFAEYDESEQMLTYQKTIQCSGNSIVQVVLMDASKEINETRKIFEDMGCQSEKVNERYFAMEILSTTDYAPIKKKLALMEEQELLSYAEPCLSEKHRLESI